MFCIKTAYLLDIFCAVTKIYSAKYQMDSICTSDRQNKTHWVSADILIRISRNDIN